MRSRRKVTAVKINAARKSQTLRPRILFAESTNPATRSDGTAVKIPGDFGNTLRRFGQLRNA
jgi:hypothetical protein